MQLLGITSTLTITIVLGTSTTAITTTMTTTTTSRDDSSMTTNTMTSKMLPPFVSCWETKKTTPIIQSTTS